jgi:lysozyme
LLPTGNRRIIVQTSAKGRTFIHLHEGNPLTCYLDPIGVPTIGPGLTNRSPTVTKMLGKLVPGKTKITNAQGDAVFAAVLAAEVDPVVSSGMPNAKQHEHDAAASGSYNLGAVRFMGWQWAKLWRAGRKSEAWAYLGDHYNTAGGKKLPGLVRRRKEEAKLGSSGIYTGVDFGNHAQPEGLPREVSIERTGPDLVVKEAQEVLAKKGFDPGKIDGWMGPKTEAAIRSYQSMHPHLVVDGKLGPATLSQLRRDAMAVGQIVKDTIIKGVPGASVAGGAAFFTGLPWHIIAPVVLALLVAFFAWRYRDVWARWLNTRKAPAQ